MKIDRQIGILSVLLQKEKVTVQNLAQRFEVSKRTVIRDIDDLNRAGIPVAASRGRGGGVYIMDGFKLDKTLLSDFDMQAILSGLQSLDSVSETGRYRQLMYKIFASDSLSDKRENPIIIDLSAWDKSAVAPKIEIIKSALEKKEKIAFCYHSPNGSGEREIEPYHLIFQWSNWYVWGFCTMRSDWRLFKLNRMTNLKSLDEKIALREVVEYKSDKLRHTNGEIKTKVKFDRSKKWRIIDDFGTESFKQDENGDILLEFAWSDKQSFYQYILTFGADAEIVFPKEFREEFSEILKKISEKYKR